MCIRCEKRQQSKKRAFRLCWLLCLLLRLGDARKNWAAEVAPAETAACPLRECIRYTAAERHGSERVDADGFFTRLLGLKTSADTLDIRTTLWSLVMGFAGPLIGISTKSLLQTSVFPSQICRAPFHAGNGDAPTYILPRAFKTMSGVVG